MYSEIDAVCSALESLISKKQCADFLTYFHDHKESYERFCWEKWLQVELALRLVGKFGEVYFDVPDTCTKNTTLPAIKTANQGGFVDLEFRLKGNNRHLRTAVEIQMSSSPKGMRPLFNALRRIRAFSGTSKKWNYRSVIGVLVYNTPRVTLKTTPFLTLLKEPEMKNRCKVISTHPHFHFIVVGWEENAVAKMKRDNFVIWLGELEKAYKQALVNWKPMQAL